MAERSNTRRVSFDPMVLISRLFSLEFIRLFIYYLCVEVDEGMCLLQGVCDRQFWVSVLDFHFVWDRVS